jgi:NitT/TauT family transport system substrate-binding protein
MIGNADFVRRNPIATKRVVRALLRAADICVSKPDWVARRLVDRSCRKRSQATARMQERVSSGVRRSAMAITMILEN